MVCTSGLMVPNPTFSIIFLSIDLSTAEYIIALAEKNNTFESFKKVLDENGAEFPVSNIEETLVKHLCHSIFLVEFPHYFMMLFNVVAGLLCQQSSSNYTTYEANI